MRSKCLNKVTKFARALNLRFLDYIPCSCKIIFGRKIFIYEPAFKIFVALLGLLECKSMTISYLYVGVLEQGDMQKGGIQRMV